MQASTLLYLSSAAGLLVSGYITDHLHWRLIFLPCLIYAILAMGLLIRYFPTLPAPSRSRADDSDWLGMVLLAIALVSLQIILSRGEIDDWFGGRHIRQLAWLGGTALLLFVTWQASDRNRTPLLKLGLLRDRRVLSAALIGTSTGMILSGSLFLLPEFLRDVANATRSATQTGQVMCIYALTAAGIRPLMVGLIARLGQRKTIALAMLMLLASMTLFNRLLTADTPVGYLVIPLLLYACCLSPLLPAVGSGTVAKIEQNKLLDGVSLYMTFRQFGASLGVALLTILISRRESLHSSRLFEHVQAGSPLSRAWLSTAANLLRAQGGYTRIEAHDAALAALAHTGARQAAVLSYADGFLFMAAVAAATLCLIPVIPPTPVVKP
jgi:DHA2 family multidrug resistance protein